jgi:hypothetical protein
LDAEELYDQIKDSVPIKKKVPYNLDGLIVNVDHYYFIITVCPKTVRFKPDKTEIDVSKYLRFFFVTIQ